MAVLLLSADMKTRTFIKDETRLNTMCMDLTFQRAENLHIEIYLALNEPSQTISALVFDFTCYVYLISYILDI